MSETEVKCKCGCGKPACYFHTKCCNAHMEGEVINGSYYVVCEKCGKMVGKLVPCESPKEEQNKLE